MESKWIIDISEFENSFLIIVAGLLTGVALVSGLIAYLVN
jgi:hypothetical protein